MSNVTTNTRTHTHTNYYECELSKTVHIQLDRQTTKIVKRTHPKINLAKHINQKELVNPPKANTTCTKDTNNDCVALQIKLLVTLYQCIVDCALYLASDNAPYKYHHLLHCRQQITQVHIIRHFETQIAVKL